MQLLKAVGILLIVLWLLLWAALKITMTAIHLLLLIGLALLTVSFLRKQRS